MTVKTHILGDMIFRYIIDENGVTGLEALPASKPATITKDYRPLSLVQIKILGEESYRGLFPRGMTTTNSLSSLSFTFADQQVINKDNSQTIITSLKNKNNCRIQHHLTWQKGSHAVTTQSIFINESSETVTLELLSSFSIGGLTPYSEDDAPETMVLHRLQTRWSDEGRLISIPIEDLGLEPSPTRVAANPVRFGQIGTMPVRDFFPFIAVEDINNGVTWGAQVAWPGSWQIEAYRLDNALHISGGLADRNHGHWMKNIAPGQSFESPLAILSVGECSIDDLCQRLTSYQYRAWEAQNIPSELDAPPLFNEWCMTWGHVNAKTVSAAANRLHNTGMKYLVMDAGWYDAAGDYNVNPERFPDGMDKTVEYVKSKGLAPGLWFEYEVCRSKAENFRQVPDMLTLDGYTITESDRHYWDMRKPHVHEMLAKRVIGLLKQFKFQYIKIDYNGNIGLGADGAESPGEGLRQHVEGVIKFVKRIREELPEIVIENCSSGGHRLEPCMMGLTTMASFSDAHETINIPIIAANLHRAIHPVQAQIWAVPRPEDTPKRLYYTMAAGLLGRLCLSGDIDKLTVQQWEIVNDGIKFYKTIAHIIKNGHTYWYGPKVKSYRHPKGWQGILRIGNSEALAVVHTFGGECEEIRMDLPKNYNFTLDECYAKDPNTISLEENRLTIKPAEDFQGIAVRLKAKKFPSPS